MLSLATITRGQESNYSEWQASRAVDHVLVNDPMRRHGVFGENKIVWRKCRKKLLIS